MKSYYEDVWKEVFLAGTEWDQFAEVDRISWEFDHLDAFLNAPDHKDSDSPAQPAHRNVYLFGGTEPQLMNVVHGQPSRVVPIPIIVAVSSKLPPPDTIALSSVQRVEEEILPMKKLKMGWFPVYPHELSRPMSFKPRVFALKCEQRRVGIRNMKEEDVHRFDYVLPYIFFPNKQEDDEPDSVINIMVDLESSKKPLVLEYDWKFDELDEFVEEQCKEQELDQATDGPVLKKAITAEVATAKAKFSEEKAAKRRKISEVSAEEMSSLDSMQIIKFYPDNREPDVHGQGFESTYINRYYGHAHQVAKQLPDEDDEMDEVEPGKK